MKLIIVEGPDNCGKDTLISKIIENFPTVTMIHCSKPLSKKYSTNEQNILFESYINNICSGFYNNTHLVLLNRGFHGEYVYGTLYRKRLENDVLNMINKLEQKLIDNKINVYYIQLMSSNYDLLSRNEDGKSLSDGDLYKIEVECNMFLHVYENSKLNKKLIYINNEDKFRTRESILNEVLSFVNN